MLWSMGLLGVRHNLATEQQQKRGCRPHSKSESTLRTLMSLQDEQFHRQVCLPLWAVQGNAGWSRNFPDVTNGPGTLFQKAL